MEPVVISAQGGTFRDAIRFSVHNVSEAARQLALRKSSLERTRVLGGRSIGSDVHQYGQVDIVFLHPAFLCSVRDRNTVAPAARRLRAIR